MLQERLDDGKHRKCVKWQSWYGVSICFMCEDALAIYRDVTSEELGEEAFRGIVWWSPTINPDGYRFCFESPTDEGEDRSFSDDA